MNITIAYFAVVLLLDTIYANKFDLNFMPDENQFSATGYEEPDSSNSGKISRDEETKKELSGNSKQKKERRTISRTFYNKVLRLMDVLQVCDDGNFDLNKIEIPNEFSKENKAIMALNQVAKMNLIKKNDIDRFKMIMKNCAQLSQAVQTKLENSMSIDSQTSGGTYEDRLKRLSESPMEDFKSRFDGRRDEKLGPNMEIEPTNSEKMEKIEPAYRYDFDDNQQVEVDLDPPGFIKFL